MNHARNHVRDYRQASPRASSKRGEVSSRFTTVSILNTALQEVVAVEVCDAGLEGNSESVSISALLPEGMSPSAAIDGPIAQEILTRQTRLFLGREPTGEELDAVLVHADECSPQPCDAEAFARPVCFALISSAEMLFY